MFVIALAAVASCSVVSPAESTRRAVEALHQKSHLSVATEQREDSPTTFSTLDWAVLDGHFFTQTNGLPIGTSARGFAVTNQGGALFWQKFQELGGVEALGYPVSRRFVWRGRPTQVFQRGVMQWDQTSKQVLLLNTLDVLSDAGKDEWLRRRHATPVPLPVDFDKGKQWPRIVNDRLALLKANPAIDSYFRQAPDPVSLYGLPTSKPEDFGDHITVRFQRAVIREWKVDWMGFKAGELTVESIGEWAIEAGLFPSETLMPEPAPSLPTDGIRTRPDVALVTTPAPLTGPQDAGTERPNQIRVGNTGGMGVYIRRTPHFEDRLIAWPDNTIMQATGRTTESEGRNWTEVRDPAGNVGWVPAEYLVGGPE